MPAVHAYWNLLADNAVLLLLLFPLLGAVAVGCLSRAKPETIHGAAVVNVLMTFGLSLVMVANYEPYRSDPRGDPVLYQMTRDIGWVAGTENVPASDTAAPAERTASETAPLGLNVRLAVGVDGISLWFVLLTTTLTLPAVISVAHNDREPHWMPYVLLLLLEAALVGVFVALDVVCFCVCLNAVLLLLFGLIGHWGGYARRAAAHRLFVLQQSAALLVLLGLTSLVVSHAWMNRVPSEGAELTFSIPQLVEEVPELAADGGLARQYWSNASPMIFVVLLLAFVILVPAIPVHGWLSAATSEAPTAARVVLLGAGTKLGCYGFVRFLVPLFPGLLPSSAGLLSLLIVAGALYAALVAMLERDMNKLAVYSCISHQGFCIAGILSLNLVGFCGGMLHAMGQGLCFGALAFLIGALEHRYRSTEIDAYSGLGFGHRRLGLCLLLVLLGAAGAPGLSGFAGGTLTLLGVLRGHPGLGPGLGLVFWGLLSAGLLAWACVSLIQRCLLGPYREPIASAGTAAAGETTDLTTAEMGGLLPALLLIVSIGLWPDFFLERMEPSASQALRAYGTTLVDDPQARSRLPKLAPSAARDSQRSEVIANAEACRESTPRGMEVGP